MKLFKLSLWVGASMLLGSMAGDVVAQSEDGTVVLNVDNSCKRGTASRLTSARSCRFDIQLEDSNGDPVEGQQIFLEHRTIDCSNRRSTSRFQRFSTKRVTNSDGRVLVGAPVRGCEQFRVAVDTDNDRRTDIASNIITVFSRNGSNSGSNGSSSSSSSSSEGSSSSRNSSSSSQRSSSSSSRNSSSSSSEGSSSSNSSDN